MTSRIHPPLTPPPGLVASRLDLGDDAFALLEWAVPSPRPMPTLTRAEREVLELVLEGLSNAAIARRRRRSPRTIANQVASIFQRLGVRSRLELFASRASTR